MSSYGSSTEHEEVCHVLWMIPQPLSFLFSFLNPAVLPAGFVSSLTAALPHGRAAVVMIPSTAVEAEMKKTSGKAL